MICRIWLLGRSRKCTKENFYRNHLANLWYCLCLSTMLLFPRGLKCAATAYLPTFPGQMLSSVSPPSLHKALCPFCPPPSCLTYALVCTLHWLFLCLCFCVSAMWNMCVHIEFSILSLPSTKLFVHFVLHPPLTSHHIQVCIQHCSNSCKFFESWNAQISFYYQVPSKMFSILPFINVMYFTHTHTIVHTNWIHVGIFGIYFLSDPSPIIGNACHSLTN